MGHTNIDLYAFCTGPVQAGASRGQEAEGAGVGGQGVLQGHEPLASFKRLLAGLPDQQSSRPVVWSLQGTETAAGKRFVEVRAQADVTLECQRCLQPFVLSVEVDNRLEIVRDPAELEGDEDEEIERIVGSSRFDVEELIEDELILSLPSVPKHVACTSAPGHNQPEPLDEPVRPSPFAALQRLKKD